MEHHGRSLAFREGYQKSRCYKAVFPGPPSLASSSLLRPQLDPNRRILLEEVGDVGRAVDFASETQDDPSGGRTEESGARSVE